MVSPPEWLSQFVNAVAQHIHAFSADLLSPLGCHFHEHSGVWEVTVFAFSEPKIVGGSEGWSRTGESHFNLEYWRRAALIFEG